jgi:hypothetical protein
MGEGKSIMAHNNELLKAMKPINIKKLNTDLHFYHGEGLWSYH